MLPVADRSCNALVRAGIRTRFALPQEWQAWSTSDWSGTYAARVHCAQCFVLSDEGNEDAVYDSQAIRRFIGIDLNREVAPDATTLVKFRRLLMREGSIVDATLIAVPSSTKNDSVERDQEMHQTRMGNQWHFRMKAHIGVDAESWLVHAVVATPAHEHDVTQAHALLDEVDIDVFADADYVGVPTYLLHQMTYWDQCRWRNNPNHFLYQ